ncbi:hypothetical protein CRYUN_Cryun13aG0022000 [Craigia yunnanensis]
MSYPLFLSVLAIFFIVLYERFLSRSTKKRKLILPPSPPKLPIIGNLHNIGSHPLRSLQAFAQQFGPLMFLRFGRVHVFVVSSADAALQIMKTNDLSFANRPKSILSSAVREEETTLAVEKIKKSSTSALPINLSELFSMVTNNVVCRVALGRKYSVGEDGNKFKKLLREFVELLDGSNVGDYIPWLAWVNHEMLK